MTEDGKVLYVRPGWLVVREGDVRSLHGHFSKSKAVDAAMGMISEDGEVVVLNTEDKVTSRLTITRYDGK